MTKMDMIWMAASILYPNISPTRLIGRNEIEAWVQTSFRTDVTPAMINRYLVSWVDKEYNKKNPVEGGSRNRYLFKTIDGMTPSKKGDFRLYKRSDGRYDGVDKSGKICPDTGDIDPRFKYLIEWYKSDYYPD